MPVNCVKWSYTLSFLYRHYDRIDRSRIVGRLDKQTIFDYFMAKNNKFVIKYHHRSRIIDSIQSKYNIFKKKC